MGNIFKRSSLVVLATILLVPFQNCSKASFGESTRQPANDSTPVLQGNGTGYGGKTYVAKLFANGQCGDGTNAYGRFVTIDAVNATLQRIECGDIAPVTVDLRTMVDHYSELPENAFDMYVYNDKIYETTPPVPLPRDMEVFYACHGTAGGRVVKVVVRGGYDSSYQAFYVGTLTENGRQHLLDLAMSSTYTIGKSWSGSTGSATYTLRTVYTDRDAAHATYQAPGISIVTTQLTCHSNF